jgi:hypothetical protein
MSNYATSLSHSYLNNGRLMGNHYPGSLARSPLPPSQQTHGSVSGLQRQSSFSHVPLNKDPSPIVIRKKPPPITYNQNISVRYIKPVPLPPHGDIVVRQMPDVQAPAQPPLHVRHQPPNPPHPPPQIIREQPPAPPPQLPAEVHTIPGRVYRAPQQIIREDFAPLPPKPPSIIIERWLPYPEQVREVVYEPAPPPIHLGASAPAPLLTNAIPHGPNLAGFGGASASFGYGGLGAGGLGVGGLGVGGLGVGSLGLNGVGLTGVGLSGAGLGGAGLGGVGLSGGFQHNSQQFLSNSFPNGLNGFNSFGSGAVSSVAPFNSF